MRSPKVILLTVALLAVALKAWAGSDAVANKPKSDRDQTTDKTTVAPAQPADEAGKSDRAPQPKPESNPSPQTRPESNQAPGSRPEPNQAPRPEPRVVQTPDSPGLSGPPVIAEPPIEAPPGGSGEFGRPPRRGNGGRGGGGHFNGGPGWHGRHDQWRHQQYHGSWSFLFHFGPVIYPTPEYFPHVVRLPRNRVGVYVRSTGDDNVGIQFANSLREHLREQGLTVVYSSDNAQFELYLVSMDEDPEETGNGSAISVSYIWYPGHKFITAQIVDVGVDEVDDLAQSVAGYANDLVDQYR